MKKTIAYLLVGAGCFAQTHSVLNLGPSQVGSPDFTTLPHTKPVQTGTALPSVCQIGELFLYTGGQGMYACTGSSNPGAWTPVASTGGLTYSGAYSSSTTYAQYSIVSFAGSSFISLNGANTGHEPDTSPAWWSVLAAAGTSGSGGIAGATSPIGYNSASQTVSCATCEVTTNKGQANGYPTLDATGKVPAAQLPAASGGGIAAVMGSAGVACSAIGGTVTCQSDPAVNALQAANNTFTANNTITGKLVPNDAATGTAQYALAKVNSSGNAVTAATSDTNTPVFPVLSATATTGNAQLVTAGNATVQTDAGGIAAGHFLVASTATPGRGMDSGAATTPSSGCWVGIASATAAPNADAIVIMAPGCANSGGGGGGGGAGSHVINHQENFSPLACSTSEQALYTYSIPANTLAKGRRLSVKMVVTASGLDANIDTALYLGAAKTAITGQATSEMLFGQVVPVIYTGDVLVADGTHEYLFWGNGFGAVSGGAYSTGPMYGAPGEDVTTALTLKATAKCGDATGTVTPLAWVVEVVQ